MKWVQLLPVLVFLELSYNQNLLPLNVFGVLKYLYPLLQQIVQLQLRTLKHTELKLNGTGCTYRWFSTAEVCMILERFNTIVFVGDELVHSVYTAFNILLREDLALGGLQQWIMSDQDRVICKCDNQFLNQDCARYAIKNRDEVKKNTGDQKGSPYFCTRKSFVTPPLRT